ncbi:MAG: hypothetical protein KatS3mg082_3448 [Nitrospiraceae bacterium]|nr:MAG: hypothetical protein KatS3mg082_3448 [Nitrospiraceae bacterium]
MQINPVNLKRAREAKGLSLERLAGKAKIDKQTIYRIETQPPKMRRMRTVKALADQLGLTVTELCGPDLELGAKERVEPRAEEKSQMNVRVSDRIRNAFALLTIRYRVSPAQVVQIAPFLFLWAAERSLQQRRDRVRQFRDAQSAMSEAFPSYLSPAFDVDDRPVDIEELSIANNDIFGFDFAGEVMEFQDYDLHNWSVPFEIVLRSMLPDMPDDTIFSDWWFDQEPYYRVCSSDAREWLGGDAVAAEHFLTGRVSIREIPSELLKAGGSALTAWVREVGDRRKADTDALFAEIDANMMQATIQAPEQGEP